MLPIVSSPVDQCPLWSLSTRSGTVHTLVRLGETHESAGDLDATRTAWQQALTILDRLDHPDAQGVRAKLAALDTPNEEPRQSTMIGV